MLHSPHRTKSVVTALTAFALCATLASCTGTNRDDQPVAAERTQYIPAEAEATTDYGTLLANADIGTVHTDGTTIRKVATPTVNPQATGTPTNEPTPTTTPTPTGTPTATDAPTPTSTPQHTLTLSRALTCDHDRVTHAMKPLIDGMTYQPQFSFTSANGNKHCTWSAPNKTVSLIITLNVPHVTPTQAAAIAQASKGVLTLPTSPDLATSNATALTGPMIDTTKARGISVFYPIKSKADKATIVTSGTISLTGVPTKDLERAAVQLGTTP